MGNANIHESFQVDRELQRNWEEETGLIKRCGKLSVRNAASAALFNRNIDSPLSIIHQLLGMSYYYVSVELYFLH
ncbi:hypothetical protein [Desulfosarcina alkanivorans]|uniref:hypothetical protein n=1 Tax=Desulfosarcina alkanivorans TaxID=571177 RepID=UPI0012D2E27A|nr:hypothetical protein [Desulfosarcina alkanivorans]